MKKLCFLFFASIISVVSNAQKLSLSAEIGNNTFRDYKSKFRFIGPERFNYHFGIAANYAMNKNLSLQSGLFYDQKNYKTVMTETFLNETGIYRYDYDINYLTIPLELKYNLKVTKGISIFAQGGLFAAYAINGTYSAGGPMICDPFGVDISNSQESPGRMDFGGQFGGGIAFNCGLYLKASYLKGAVNLSKFNNTSVNSEALQFSIGFTPKIKFGKKNKPSVSPGTPKF